MIAPQLESFDYIIIFMMTIVMALGFPYVSKDRAEFVNITSVYRPLALFFLGAHFLVLLVVSLFDLKYSLLSPTFLLLADIFVAMEIRSVRAATKKRAEPAYVLLLVASVSLFSLLAFTQFDAAFRVLFYSALTIIVVLWICVELTLSRRYFGRSLYVLTFASAMGIAISILLRFVVAEQSGLFVVGNLKSNSNVLMNLAFTAYGFLFVSLLALNHAYTLSLWRSSAFQRRSTELNLLKVLRNLAAVRDNQTGQHISRTSHFVKTLAKNLKAKGKLDDRGDPNFIGALVRAAPLHDLGKVTTPDAILLKTAKLGPQELFVMRQHAVAGAEILSAASSAMDQDSAAFGIIELASHIAGAHHERWDGSGYPLQLKGADIPQPARIMSVADVYDALTSARSYKVAWSHEAALAHIIGLSGTQFDPEVVEALRDESETFRAIAKRFAD